MTAEYPALIERPKEIDPAAMRPGCPAQRPPTRQSAPFDFFGWVLLYGRALALYL